jgi:tRNA A-37 threonylcarbamoyl transferase component Bud32
MSEANRCPECGVELSTGALAGLCPKCLLAAGLESQAGPQQSAGSGSEAPTTPHSGSFIPPEPAALAAYFPQLEIIELLGHGGMGAVYKARQPKLDRLVALKIIRPEAADTPAFAERFNREARMLARLSNPQIVGVYDFGEVSVSDPATGSQPRPLYYFLMEYVDGASMRQLMSAGELTPQQALAIVPQICDALQFAHNEGVVHRDIKPENILLDKRGRVKIADFGLAKLAAPSPEDFTLTGTHQVMGTPRYMAPEQMEGSHAVDHRADIYSLGVVFYEMLTGEVPAGHFEPPSRKVAIDVRLDEVVLRAMAREPERRYQHASEVRTDIDSICRSVRPDMASPAISDVTDDEGEESWRGFLWGVIHVCIVVILLIFGLGILMGGEDALRPLGIPATGIWVRAAQLVGLILMITAGLSLGYEWKLPSRRQTGSRKGDRFAFAPRALAREPERPYQQASDVRTDVEPISATARPTQRGGRDWVTLTREQVDNDLLPDCCIVCGQHTVERVNKDFWYQSDWAQVLMMVGFFCGVLPALIIGPLTTHTIRVACPTCPTHRDASRRLVWIASTGWLAAPVLALIGFGLAYPLVGIEVPAVLVAPSLGVVVGLVAYLVPVIRLWRQTVQTVGVEWMTNDYVRFRGVSAAFARKAAQMSGAPQSDSAITSRPPRSPSAIRMAWDDWWAERDRWLTTGVQSVLGIGFFVCLILYISFYSSSERLPDTDGQRLRHTIVTIGVPDPWFKWETYPDKRTPFQWRIDLVSTSAGIMLLGFLGWCLNWQIEKAKANATGKQLRWWHGSPNFAIAIWGVFTLAAIVIGIAVAELPQRLDRRVENRESPPSEKQVEPNDEEKPSTRATAPKSNMEIIESGAAATPEA